MIDMEAGELNRRIFLQHPMYETKPSGEKKITGWADAKLVWANMKTISSQEMVLAEKPQMMNTVIFTIRYFPGLPTTYRIKYDGNRFFDITGITNVDEQNVWLEITAVEHKQK